MTYHSKVLIQCLTHSNTIDGLSYLQVFVVILSLPKSYTILHQSKMNNNFQVFILLNTDLSFSPFFLHFLHFSLLVHRQTDPGDLNSDFSNPSWVLICYMEEKKKSISLSRCTGVVY